MSTQSASIVDVGDAITSALLLISKGLSLVNKNLEEIKGTLETNLREVALVQHEINNSLGQLGNLSPLAEGIEKMTEAVLTHLGDAVPAYEEARANEHAALVSAIKDCGSRSGRAAK